MPLSELFPFTSHTIEETFGFGAKLAAFLQQGDIVALFGEMGAGKTHLVKGMASVWGIDPASVSSPTFTIVNEYDGQYFPIYHFDAYRINHPDAFIEMGFEDYFFGEGLTVVEWPENVASLLPPETIRIRLTHISPTERRFSLMPDDANA